MLNRSSFGAAIYLLFVASAVPVLAQEPWTYELEEGDWSYLADTEGPDATVVFSREAVSPRGTEYKRIWIRNEFDPSGDLNWASAETLYDVDCANDRLRSAETFTYQRNNLEQLLLSSPDIFGSPGEWVSPLPESVHKLIVERACQ